MRISLVELLSLSSAAGENTSGNIISDQVNITIIDNWREEWMGEDTPGGSAVTTSELQDAIHHWLENLPVRGYTLSTMDLQEVISLWLSG